LKLTQLKDRQLIANHIADFTLRNLRAVAPKTKRKEKSQ
jgi:hypothetical protein